MKLCIMEHLQGHMSLLLLTTHRELEFVACRLQTWTRPNNPGLTAAEALTSNFFTKRTSCRMVVEKQRTFEKQR